MRNGTNLLTKSISAHRQGLAIFSLYLGRYSINYINISYSELFKSTFQIDMEIKLRMEIGNVPKRQQPDHRADNRSSIQREILAPGGVLRLAPKQIYTGSVIMNTILNSKLYYCLVYYFFIWFAMCQPLNILASILL